MPSKVASRAFRERFAREYLIDNNQTRAYMRASHNNPNEGTARAMACALMKEKGVKRRIRDLQKKSFVKLDVSAERVLKETAAISFIDARKFFDADGNFVLPGQWTEEMGAAVKKFEVLQRNLSGADGKTDTIYRVELWDKGKPLENLGKHNNLFQEKVEHSGNIQMSWDL